MLERLVADVLVRVLGQYVEGISAETVRVGVWGGNLELHALALRPDALAVLFETLGLDLPVTVVAGAVGTLSLRVPWKALRSSPVVVGLTDVAVVASPVSDGDQDALAARDARLKAAQLDTDDAVREARFSVRAAAARFTRLRKRFTASIVAAVVANIQVAVENVVVQYQDASSVRDRPYTVSLAVRSMRATATDARWVEQFPDASSAHSASSSSSSNGELSGDLDSAPAASPAAEADDGSRVFKVLHLDGLVLNWVPGTGDTSHERLNPRVWADEIRADARRRVIHPVTGRLRISLAAAEAAAAAVAAAEQQSEQLSQPQPPSVSMQPPAEDTAAGSPGPSSPRTPDMRSTARVAASAAQPPGPRPRVELDLCFPDVRLAFDDFQYHTLLSTIMYLSDIDRKVRPRSPRARWFWALDRLLPRFKERHEARLRFCVDGLRERREHRELYIRARKAVVAARRANAHADAYAAEASILRDMETVLPLEDILLFRDLSERQMVAESANASRLASASTSSLGWLLGCVRPRAADPTVDNELNSGTDSLETRETGSLSSSGVQDDHTPSSSGTLARKRGLRRRASRRSLPENEKSGVLPGGAGSSEQLNSESLPTRQGKGGSESTNSAASLGSRVPGSSFKSNSTRSIAGSVPAVRFSFLLGRGSIQLSKGGFPKPPVGISCLEFCELRLGVTTWPDGSELLVEALLGTLDVLDLRAGNGVKVMYPRADWAGGIDADLAAKGDSYPTATSASLEQICGNHERSEPALFTPTKSGLESTGGLWSPGSTSTSSLHSDGGGSASGTREDLTRPQEELLTHLVALRLQKEPVSSAVGTANSRLAMDLAIGGMETLVDGPNGAFISSLLFWHPREKLPSIMHFLGRSAAPRLAALRMDIQRMLLDKKAPMRMNIFIRAPRFVVPGPEDSNLSLVVDLGTFGMETTDGIALRNGENGAVESNEQSVGSGHLLDLSCTNYRMMGSDLGVFIVTAGDMRIAERLVKPFSLRILLQVLNEAAYLEAVMDHVSLPSLARVRMFGRLSSLRTTITQKAFRSLLKIAHRWSNFSETTSQPSGIEPNSPRRSNGLSGPVGIVPPSLPGSPLSSPRASKSELPQVSTSPGPVPGDSKLTSFDMRVELDDLRLELRDSLNKRVVTVSSKSTELKFAKGFRGVDVDYRVREFNIEDGSRGATAPFRRLLYAGTEGGAPESGAFDLRGDEKKAFVHVQYKNDEWKQEQTITVHVLSLSMVCVRETYLALADFFYRNDDTQDDVYVDPFSAVGMTTSSAVQALRTQAGRGVEMSKRALAQRGTLKVSAMLEGFDITLITAEGAIASFDVSGCAVRLTQSTAGDVYSSGKFESLRVRDLTAAYDFHSQTITYARNSLNCPDDVSARDGWVFELPQNGNMYLRSRMTNLRIVYLQRFIVILNQYLSALRDELQPVLTMKGGISEVFDTDAHDTWKDMSTAPVSRLHLDISTHNVDIIMPRHSQAPHEALRFVVGCSTVSNEELAAPGYQIGVRITASDVSCYVLFADPAKQGSPLAPLSFSSVKDLVPFSTNTHIVGKLDLLRCRRVPEVVLNAEGHPVLKDGEHERDYDPQQWLPALRARLQVSKGLTARLCEAEYSIMYFVFTENVIERPEIEFTDIVRGLKTPILPPRRPIQPLMLSSHRLPSQYSIVFEIPSISAVIAHGADPRAERTQLIGSELENVAGRFDYGVDCRMSIELSCDLKHVEDLRRVRKRHRYIIRCGSESSEDGEDEKSFTLSWDRPFGLRANVMLLVSGLKVIVVPELFRDLGMLTVPGSPYLSSSAPPPYLRFNGRLLIVTLSQPEIFMPSDEYEGDHRGLIGRGDLIAKVQWAALTGRRLVEVASKGLRLALSSAANFEDSANATSVERPDGAQETPLLYPLDVSLRFHAGGYDPPATLDGEPVRAPGSTLSVNAESLLGRVDVNDTSTLLAVASRLAISEPSPVLKSPRLPGRFDRWKDVVEEGDAKLSVHFALPQARLLVTDGYGGRFVPIMEVRARNALLRSNVPWLTNAQVELSLDLFNEEKGWWEPGIERFPVELTASQGRSGSIAINARANESIDVNVSPSTVSGAARVGKTIKYAVEDLRSRLHAGKSFPSGSSMPHMSNASTRPAKRSAPADGRRPSVAAFCVKNSTGRPAAVWRVHDSTRRPLRGDGGEVEIDMETDEVMWSALVDTNGVSTDPSRSRDATMRCFVSFSGYRPVSLSAAEIGVECVTFVPEARENTEDANSLEDFDMIDPITMVWDVSMHNGVPVGCLRSMLRIRNDSGIALDVYVGRKLSKSQSVSSALLGSLSGSLEKHALPSRSPSRCVVQTGDSWCVPVHCVGEPIRVRPALFRAPDDEEETIANEELAANQQGQRVLYSYQWSSPLGRLEKFRAMGSAPQPTASVMVCSSTDARSLFHFTVLPNIDHSLSLGGTQNHRHNGWIDLRVQAPIVLRNCLPRALAFAVADSETATLQGSDAILARDILEPDRETHIYTAGADMSLLAFGVGYQNMVGPNSEAQQTYNARPSPVASLHVNFASLHSVPVGSSRAPSLTVRLKHDVSPACHAVTVFADFWIQNLSDVDLFFKDSSVDVRGSGNVSTTGRQKTLLRACPPGTSCDPFVCFTGSWLSFQRADSLEDVWVHVDEEVTDIDKPVRLPFRGLGLAMEVRPARGDFQSSLIATVRNTGWIQNRTSFPLQWCQPAALTSRGIALSAHVHSVGVGETLPLHWDYLNEEKSVCLRRMETDGSSSWIWSRPVTVESAEGEFAAKMYRPNRHEQYIARAVVSRRKHGVHVIAVHAEDRSTPPYRIVNLCGRRSIAFRQTGVEETHPWLVRPGKTTRYSWDDPRAPLKRRTLVVEVIEPRPGPAKSESVASLPSLPRLSELQAVSSGSQGGIAGSGTRGSGPRGYKFELGIDRVSDSVPFAGSDRFHPQMNVSVSVDGPTKVVTFSEQNRDYLAVSGETSGSSASVYQSGAGAVGEEGGAAGNVDVEVYVKAIGVSMVESTPAELVYVNVSSVLFRLDRFDSSELVMFEIADVQVDNQLPSATWPVLLWSPAPSREGEAHRPALTRESNFERKPFLQITADAKHPRFKSGISRFKGIFAALQHVELAADEELALRLLLFVQSLLEASGEAVYSKNEDLSASRAEDSQVRKLVTDQASVPGGNGGSVLIHRLYVEQLELCPLHITVSFSSSRSSAPVHVAGYRTLMRTLTALFGNVENAEFRFNALELRHVFDTTLHFQSLIAEFYAAQAFGQKMTLLASNPLIGNPSALFDSIAMGTRDFFVEPARAKGSAEFIAGIGRGSSSLLTNTVGGIVGSLGGIPRAVAQGLETAVGDKDYLAARESIRGRARFASSPAEGLFTGAMSFGHGIVSGAKGLVREPVVGAMESGPSGFFKGLGRGVIGGVLKPVTGALDLIGEPAVGFRSMMTTVNKDFAEPVRPPRAFWGPGSNRLVTYDLHEALGQALLSTIGRISGKGGEQGTLREQLWEWTPLVAVDVSASNHDLASFLWALHRRSSPRSQLRSKAVLDGLGEPQRAEKVRCALVTQLRVVLATLDGHVIWQRGLMEIVDTQVSLEANDTLMIGLRPLGPGPAHHQVTPTWKRVGCGSSSRRDVLSNAIKKALVNVRGFTGDRLQLNNLPIENVPFPDGEQFHSVNNGSHVGGFSDHFGEIEMIEMSAVETSLAELPDVDVGDTQDTSAVSESSRPVRGVTENMGLRNSAKAASLQSYRSSAVTFRDRLSPRSLRLSFCNSSGTHLDVVRYSLTSGMWVATPPEDGIPAGETAFCEVGVGIDDACDLAGGVVFRFRKQGMESNQRSVLTEDNVGLDDGSGAITFCFMNPMLASNAFSVAAPLGVTVNRFGGDHGDHADVHISISKGRST